MNLDEPTNARKKVSAWRKFFVGLGVVLVVLIAVGACAPMVLSCGTVRKAVLGMVNNRLAPAQVSIEDWSFAWTQSQRVSGISYVDPERQMSVKVAHLSTGSLLSLLPTGKVALDVTVDAPEVTLPNLTELMAAQPRIDVPTAGDDGAAKDLKLPFVLPAWDVALHLKVKDAKVVSPCAEQPLVRDGRLEVAFDALTAPIAMTLSANVLDTPLSAEAQVAPVAQVLEEGFTAKHVRSLNVKTESPWLKALLNATPAEQGMIPKTTLHAEVQLDDAYALFQSFRLAPEALTKLSGAMSLDVGIDPQTDALLLVTCALKSSEVSLVYAEIAQTLAPVISAELALNPKNWMESQLTNLQVQLPGVSLQGKGTLTDGEIALTADMARAWPLLAPFLGAYPLTEPMVVDLTAKGDATALQGKLDIKRRDHLTGSTEFSVDGLELSSQTFKDLRVRSRWVLDEILALGVSLPNGMTASGDFHLNAEATGSFQNMDANATFAWQNAAIHSPMWNVNEASLVEGKLSLALRDNLLTIGNFEVTTPISQMSGSAELDPRDFKRLSVDLIGKVTLQAVFDTWRTWGNDETPFSLQGEMTYTVKAHPQDGVLTLAAAVNSEDFTFVQKGETAKRYALPFGLKATARQDKDQICLTDFSVTCMQQTLSGKARYALPEKRLTVEGSLCPDFEVLFANIPELAKLGEKLEVRGHYARPFFLDVPLEGDLQEIIHSGTVETSIAFDRIALPSVTFNKGLTKIALKQGALSLDIGFDPQTNTLAPEISAEVALNPENWMASQLTNLQAQLPGVSLQGKGTLTHGEIALTADTALAWQFVEPFLGAYPLADPVVVVLTAKGDATALQGNLDIKRRDHLTGSTDFAIDGLDLAAQTFKDLRVKSRWVLEELLALGVPLPEGMTASGDLHLNAAATGSFQNVDANATFAWQNAAVHSPMWNLNEPSLLTGTLSLALREDLLTVSHFEVTTPITQMNGSVELDPRDTKRFSVDLAGVLTPQTVFDMWRTWGNDETPFSLQGAVAYTLKARPQNGVLTLATTVNSKDFSFVQKGEKVKRHTLPFDLKAIARQDKDQIVLPEFIVTCMEQILSGKAQYTLSNKQFAVESLLHSDPNVLLANLPELADLRDKIRGRTLDPMTVALSAKGDATALQGNLEIKRRDHLTGNAEFAVDGLDFAAQTFEDFRMKSLWVVDEILALGVPLPEGMTASGDFLLNAAATGSFQNMDANATFAWQDAAVHAPLWNLNESSLVEGKIFLAFREDRLTVSHFEVTTPIAQMNGSAELDPRDMTHLSVDLTGILTPQTVFDTWRTWGSDEKPFSLQGEMTYTLKAQPKEGVLTVSAVANSKDFTFVLPGEKEKRYALPVDLEVTAQWDKEQIRLSDFVVTCMEQTLSGKACYRLPEKRLMVEGLLRPDLEVLVANIPELTNIRDKIEVRGRYARPFSLDVPLDGGLQSMINSGRAETSIAFDHIVMPGATFNKGLAKITLKNGILSLDGDYGVNDGIVSIHPRLSFSGDKWVMRLDRDQRMLDNVNLTSELFKALFGYACPMLEGSAEMTGKVSLTFNEMVVPLNDKMWEDSRVSMVIETRNWALKPSPMFQTILKAIGERDVVYPPDQNFHVHLENGFITSDTIHFRIEQVKVLCNGKTNVVNKEIEYTVSVLLTPDLVAKIVSKTAARFVREGDALNVPVRGTLQDPKVDVVAAIKDLSKLFFKRAAGGVLSNILGSSNDN